MQVNSRALAPSLLGDTSRTVQEVVLVLAGTLALIIAAKVKVPFYPVPMTLQTLAVMAIAVTFGLRLGVTTVLAYLAEGALGLPVFTNTPPLAAGPAYLLGPTGGFLAGFVVLAVVVGYAADRGWSRSVPKLASVLLVGDVIVMALGFTWLAAFAQLPTGGAGIGMAKAWAGGVAPFILGDLLKIALVALAVPATWRLIARD
ncbi:MAG: biotin transporter BioY [Rhizobiales bacterium]|jgi:biotin transport system substrate-specific component|nr:biotin transporter BioY [Hyphomicrobiales bacterium]